MKLAQARALYIFVALAILFTVNANADTPNELIAEVTNGVFITLTAEPCSMYESPPNVILFKAYGVDTTINHEAEGCFSKESDGTVVINLVNSTNNNQYGYVLPQSLFSPKHSI